MIVVFEGVNGAGKTTLIEAVGSTIAHKKIRGLKPGGWLTLLNEKMPTSLGMFVAICWYSNTWIPKIEQRPKERGQVHDADKKRLVLQDRGILSEATHLPNATRKTTKMMYRVFSLITQKADLLVLVDTPGELAETRARDRQRQEPKPNLNAEAPYIEQRRQLFLELLQTYPGLSLKIDGTRPTDELAQIVKEAIEKVM